MCCFVFYFFSHLELSTSMVCGLTLEWEKLSVVFTSTSLMIFAFFPPDRHVSHPLWLSHGSQMLCSVYVFHTICVFVIFVFQVGKFLLKYAQVYRLFLQLCSLATQGTKAVSIAVNCWDMLLLLFYLWHHFLLFLRIIVFLLSCYIYSHMMYFFHLHIFF